VLMTSGVDTGTSAYYSVADGKLVALVDYSANFGGSRSCVASNAAIFTPPDCALVELPCSPGVGDAGLANDAASHD
jgi:hypothetical protein